MEGAQTIEATFSATSDKLWGDKKDS